MRIYLAAMFERAFAALEYWAQDMRMRAALCPDCGRNRYTGRPCK